MKFRIFDYVEMVFIYFENIKSLRVTSRIFDELYSERHTPNNIVIDKNI
jgi:hypothetical protein